MLSLYFFYILVPFVTSHSIPLDSCTMEMSINCYLSYKSHATSVWNKIFHATLALHIILEHTYNEVNHMHIRGWLIIYCLYVPVHNNGNLRNKRLYYSLFPLYKYMLLLRKTKQKGAICGFLTHTETHTRRMYSQCVTQTINLSINNYIHMYSSLL